MTFLHEWKLNHLPPDTRPLPSATPYNRLLRHRRASTGDHREEEAQCPLPRPRGSTEQAATTGTDTACRPLRLPSIRSRFVEIADRAAKDLVTYRGSSPSCW